MTEKKKPFIREHGLTYNDYAALDDDNRYELVNGQLELMSPAPTPRHQLFSYQLQKKISASCENEYFILHAPIDLILSDQEVRQPDIILIHRDRSNIISRKGIEGPPDLVIEILSPSTLKRDKLDKRHAYARFHIPEYWIVDPEMESLEQHALTDGQYEMSDIYQGEDRVTSQNLHCISSSMKEIIENIPDI